MEMSQLEPDHFFDHTFHQFIDRILDQESDKVHMLEESSVKASLNSSDSSHINNHIGTSHSQGIQSSTVSLESLVEIEQIDNPVNNSSNGSKGKKHYYEGSSGNDCPEKTQSNKKVARHCEEANDLSDMIDKVLLCPDYHMVLQSKESALKERKDGTSGRKKRKEMAELKSFLNQCALFVSYGNIVAAREILNRIRTQSSPHGDGAQRLAHYIANAIEARITGTGTTLYADYRRMAPSLPDMVKAYEAYFLAVPFQRMSNIFANKTIYKQTMGATRLHIIDFGISYGFQWPYIIQAFSQRPGGTPNLRITGIDFPEPGFQPSNLIEMTGVRLGDYCKRFNVPFQYNCIAKNWDSIQLEDLKIEEGEMLVVNSLYGLRHLPDETVVDMCPRETVLSLIKKINPELIVLGVLNENYSSPFFPTRFREALTHFSTVSDMLETTLANEDSRSRLVLEQELLAKDAMNVIACEGTSRIERPEKYKQWLPRIKKAGLAQIPLTKAIFEEVEAMVKLQYNKKFLVREENNWMVQGWNKRVLYALSLWTPVQE